MSESTSTEIESVSVTANAVEGLYEVIDRLGGKAGILSTIPMNTHEDRIKVLAAVENSQPIADILGKTINVTNIVVQATDMVNEQTGEMQTVPRVVLYDDKGVGHHAISGPLFRSVRTLLGIAGDPATWVEPVGVKITKEGSGSRQFFKLQYV